MKKTFLLFALVLVSTTVSIAQLSEAHVAYAISIESDDPEMASYASMFENSTLDLYFNDDFSRVEMDMGMLMKMATISDLKSGDILILMGGMMGQTAITSSKAEMEGEETEASESRVALSKSKKKILGYKCKKATVTDADGNELIYWYTPKIKSQSIEANDIASKIPGLALEYETNRDGMTMKFLAETVETKLDAATIKEKFTTQVPEGYEVMTYKEFTEMNGESEDEE